MKAFLIVLVFLAIGGFLILRPVAPPTNDVVARQFDENKAVFTQLRDMLLADKPIVLVAPWGIEKIGTISAVAPPIAEMPSGRYQKYLKLLSGSGAKAVSKHLGQTGPEICVLIWRAGMGDAIHVAACWLENDARQRSAKGPIDRQVYYPLGDHWYVWRDYTWQ